MQADYIMTPAKSYKRPVKATKINIKDKKDMATNELKNTKQHHKAAIKQLRKDIKRHKLLIKQAKLAYRISK